MTSIINYDKESAKSFIRLMKRYSKNEINSFIENSDNINSEEDKRIFINIQKHFLNDKLIEMNNNFEKIKKRTQKGGSSTVQQPIKKDDNQEKKNIVPKSNDKSEKDESTEDSATSSEMPTPQNITIVNKSTIDSEDNTLQVPDNVPQHQHDIYKDSTFIQQTFPVKGSKKSNTKTKKSESPNSKSSSDKKSAYTTACVNSSPPYFRPSINIET